MSLINYFSKGELALWGGSVLLTITSFVLFDSSSYLTLCASLIGVTSLIFNAKGNPFGQFLIIIFSILYGIISLSFSYYGEMLTYMGMALPMAVFSLVSWMKNPYKGNKSQVKVNRLSKKEQIFMWILSAAVTVVFYYVLSYFNTANIIPSTISVTTSFLGAYLTFRRSPFFGLGYAANDIVLIVMWILATTENLSYLSVIVCFIAFLLNDIYGFINWRRIEKSQAMAQ